MQLSVQEKKRHSKWVHQQEKDTEESLSTA